MSEGYTKTNTPWDSLSLSERTSAIKNAVKRGVYNLDSIHREYNEYAKGGYKPSKSIKDRIAAYEGAAMTGAIDPLSGKYAKNNSFEAEAAGFYNALPANIRQQVINNPELADNLFSYSYNVGVGNFKKRVVPALEKYFSGQGSVEDVQNSMWASGDSKLAGLRRRRAEEKAGVGSALASKTPTIQDSNPPSFPTFDEWKNAAESNLGFDIDNSNDYDYRSYYKNEPDAAWEMVSRDSRAPFPNTYKHFPDTYQTVFHPTFSDESMYSGKEHPFFNPLGLVGGHWKDNDYIMSDDMYFAPVSMDDRLGYLIDAENNGASLRESDGSIPYMSDGTFWGGVLPNVNVALTTQPKNIYDGETESTQQMTTRKPDWRWTRVIGENSGKPLYVRTDENGHSIDSDHIGNFRVYRDANIEAPSFMSALSDSTVVANNDIEPLYTAPDLPEVVVSRNREAVPKNSVVIANPTPKHRSYYDATYPYVSSYDPSYIFTGNRENPKLTSYNQFFLDPNNFNIDKARDFVARYKTGIKALDTKLPDIKKNLFISPESPIHYAPGSIDNESKKTLMHNVIDRNIRENPAFRAFPESYRDNVDRYLNSLNVFRLPVKQGQSVLRGAGAVTLRDPDQIVSMAGGTNINFLPHEFRHFLDYKQLPLTNEQLGILDNAYNGDFYDFHKASHDRMSRDRLTTNLDARNYFLRKHDAEFIDLDTQDSIIDNATDAEIIEAVEKCNGYGQNYIDKLRKTGELTPEKVQQFREAFKHVG